MAQDDALSVTPVYVPCAGEGTRLFPFTEITPKALLPIGGKPCATIITDMIRSAGFTNIVVIHRTRDKAAFEHEFRDTQVQFLADDGETTASHFARIHSSTHASIARHFIVWYGDCLVNVNLRDVYEQHVKQQNDATLVLTKKARLEFGLVRTEGGLRHKVKKMEEKPIINASIWTGIAVLRTESVMPFIGGGGNFGGGKDFAYDVFPGMIAARKDVGAVKIEKEWFDIGSYSAYKKVNELAQRGEFFWKE